MADVEIDASSLDGLREAAPAALDKLRDKAANTDENLMPHILDCVRAYCSVGEMSGVFRDVFGEFKEPIDF